MMLTMKLWCSLWLLDLVHAAKVKPSVNVAVAAPLDLVVQEPGFGSSNHTQLFKKLGDEPALALMNVTTNHSLFVKGDEAVHDLGNASEMYMEEGMEHDIVDGLESEGEHNTTMLMDTMRSIIMMRNTTISWNMMKTTCPSSKRWTRMIPLPWLRKWLRKKG